MKEYLYFYEQRTRYHSKLIVLTRERKKEYFERGKNNFVIKLEQFSRDNGNSVFLEPTKRRCKKISARYEEKERKKKVSEFVKTINDADGMLGQDESKVEESFSINYAFRGSC